MSEVLQLTLGRIATPIGEMEIVTDDEGNLRVVDWTDYDSRMHRLLRRYYGEGAFKLAIGRNPEHVTGAIEKYFAGDLHAIDNLAVQTGGTTFQREVWSALRKIPCGTTVSYATIAQRIGRESAVRAVGLANGANPVGVVVPCHRVIGADGSLTGYGGGLERKRWLLEHESRPSRTLFPGPARDATKGPVLTSAIVES
jgi:methylated-DNA-[protein]-cysteine S-methyltransferase